MNPAHIITSYKRNIRGCIQKFPDWPPGARTAHGAAYHYFVSQSSDFCSHNPFVASQRVFIVVSVYFVMTQSGNFWIHPRMCLYMYIYI